MASRLIKRVAVSANIIELAPNLFIAASSVAGITIRGGTRADPMAALASFYQVLGGVSGNTDDAAIALSFLMAGTDFDAALMAIEDGSDDK